MYSIDRLCRMQMAAAILPEQPISTVGTAALAEQSENLIELRLLRPSLH